MNDIDAYTVGSKSENMDMLRGFLLEALDDHLYWRRNFHAEDPVRVTSAKRATDDYHAFRDRLHDHLAAFLSSAKSGVPFFSPRYLGHMNADVLIPGLVGYFAEMLYNQNNVAGESSPVTSRHEQEAVAMIGRMVGYGKESWGYLTSGGTMANFYSLWVARNVRTFPLAIRLAAMELAKNSAQTRELHAGLSDDARAAIASGLEGKGLAVISALLLNLEVTRNESATKRKLPRRATLGELSAWDLMNLRFDAAGVLLAEAKKKLRLATGAREGTCAEIFQAFVSPFTLPVTGESKFRALAQGCFPQEPFLRGPWYVFVPSNNHYSWKKAMDVFGIGQEQLITVPHNAAFELDCGALRMEMSKRVLGSDAAMPIGWSVLVAATFGSTEEGAIDDLGAIRRVVLRDFETESGSLSWFHVDAAYGGYVAAMFRDPQGDLVPVGQRDQPGSLIHWLYHVAESASLSEAQARELIEMSEQDHDAGAKWLSWSQLRERCDEMSRADSITIDPHKLGYVPYPAGTVLLREGKAKEFVSATAPYLWAHAENADGFTGRFTMEGSRPGAAAAGCWLAHRTVPLDQSAHGKLVARTFLGARQLYQLMRDSRVNHVHGTCAIPVHAPHTNMLCYLPFHRGLENDAHMSKFATAVAAAIAPVRRHAEFMAVSTEVAVPLENLRGLVPMPQPAKFFPATGGTRPMAKVLRTVVMNPYAIDSMVTRNGTPLPTFEAYLAFLKEEMEGAYDRMIIEMSRERGVRTPQRILLVDDERIVAEDFWELLKVHLQGAKIPFENVLIKTRETEAAAIIDDDRTPLNTVFLDLDMSLTDGQPNSGLRLYEKILERNERAASEKFQVGAVGIVTRGRQGFDAEMAAIKARHPHLKKLPNDAGFVGKECLKPGSTEFNAIFARILETAFRSDEVK